MAWEVSLVIAADGMSVLYFAIVWDTQFPGNAALRGF